MGRADGARGVGVRRCSFSIVGVQRTVQNNGNVKSEPKYLACEQSPVYLLSTFELFLVLLSLSWLSTVGFFLRVGSHRLRSALVYALRSANTYVAKGQSRCSPRPPSARNVDVVVVPTSSCNARVRHPAWA